MRHLWILVVALGACSKKSEPAKTDPAAAAGSAAAVGSAAPGGSAGSAAPSAALTGCDLLKKEEAAKLAGGDVEDCIESDEEGVGSLYNAKVGNGSVALVVYRDADGKAKCDSIKSTEDGPVDVTGVGDQAYRTKAGGQMFFVAHNRCAGLVVNTLGSKQPVPTPEVFGDVAKAIAARL